MSIFIELDELDTKALDRVEADECDTLVKLFNGCFAESLNTRLVKGGSEPLYLPAGMADGNWGATDYHRVIFTRDYAASALHEIAHWLVAGETRRLQLDYGYWYVPDGRNPEQQRSFERAEVTPQALEWLLNVACGRRFRISADNLEMGLGASDGFKIAIRNRALRYCREGANRRARTLIAALSSRFGVTDVYRPDHYLLQAL